MVKRTIAKTGNALYVSLPPLFLEVMDLVKGNKVNLKLTKYGILIQSEKGDWLDEMENLIPEVNGESCLNMGVRK